MDVVFYYNQSDDRQINKILDTGETFVGSLRDEVSIMNPVVRFDTDAVLRYNYCYIPEFQRYYAITNVVAYREGLFDVSMDVDVLMSFRRHILQLPCVVDKQTDATNGDEYIDDSSLVTDNVMYSTVYNFPNGFNDTPEFILITAG